MFGATGTVLDSPPATAGLAYKISPSLNIEVLIFLTLPKEVTKPSSPAAIASVVTPIIYLDDTLPLAMAGSTCILPLAPLVPLALTTVPSGIVTAVWFLT